MSIAVIGGDERALWLSVLMRERGAKVSTLGLIAGDGKGVEGARVCVLPYPYAARDGLVPSLTGRVIRLAEALKSMRGGARVISGMGAQEAVEEENAGREREGALAHYGFSDDEEFLLKNAEISAEGAIARAMSDTPFALSDAKCVVTGYGLFASAIARRLIALGANVRVAARSAEARAIAEKSGARAYDMTGIAECAIGADLLMNTVPHPILTYNELKSLPPDIYLYELAGAPYGIDAGAARRLNMRFTHLPGIPGRYAPKSAALAMLGAISRVPGVSAP